MKTTRARTVTLLLGWLCLDAGAPWPVAAADLTSLATNTALAASTPQAPLAVVQRTERFSRASQNVALTRSVVSSGPGWVNETFEGVAGPLAFTDAADYFIVTDLDGIDGVPLGEVVGAEFASFLKAKMRENALETQNLAERVYVLQKSALQAVEPLWLDRDQIVLDPYAYLDVTICVPMPVVGGITTPVFSPETVIREIADGVLEYHEVIQTGAVTDFVRLGTTDLRAVPSVANLAVTLTGVGGTPTGAVAQAASSGGMSCFNLRDIMGDGDGASCSVDFFRPDTWYREHVATGTLDLTPPDASLPVTIDTSSGADSVLSGVFDGKLRLDTQISFQDEQGRGVGGKVKVKVGALFCVPLWLRPVEGRLWAHIDASRELEVNATIQYSPTSMGQVTKQLGGTQQVSSLDAQLPDPREILRLPMEAPLFLYPIAFMVGPVPVALILDAPVEVGLVAGVASPTFTNFEVKGGIRAGFDYTCRFGGSCEANEPVYFEPWAEAGVTGDIGLEGRAFVKPYLGLGLRASLYWPGAIFAKVTPRAYLNLELWGASKRCGDADANGDEEYVHALTVDQDAGLELIGQIGVYQPPTGEDWINDLIDFVAPLSFPIGDPLNWHLTFTNLLSPDGNAFQPMLTAPASVQEDAPATFGARMRPCYPYSDDMRYDVLWGDGGYSSVEGDPQVSAPVVHTWSNPGSYPVTLNAVQDRHGRVFDEAFGTALETTLTRSVAVNAKLVAKLPVGGVVSRIVTKGR